MQPAVPDDPDAFAKASASAPQVGAYRRGTPASRWALARYLVGRVIAESVGTTLYIIALALLAVAVVVQLTVHLTVLAVLVGVVGLVVLVLRWALVALLRRLTTLDVHGPAAARLGRLVDDTHRDVFRELRRLGLPGHTLTLPLLALRLVGRRRRDTMTRLRGFDVDRAVPAARVDEVHMLLDSVFGGAPAPDPRSPHPAGPSGAPR